LVVGKTKLTGEIAEYFGKTKKEEKFWAKESAVRWQLVLPTTKTNS